MKLILEILEFAMKIRKKKFFCVFKSNFELYTINFEKNMGPLAVIGGAIKPYFETYTRSGFHKVSHMA